MKQGVPQLIAWPISGNPTHHRVFLQRLRALCSPSGDTRPIPTMVPPLLSGLAGVTSGVEIPFRDLYSAPRHEVPKIFNLLAHSFFITLVRYVLPVFLYFYVMSYLLVYYVILISILCHTH